MISTRYVITSTNTERCKKDNLFVELFENGNSVEKIHILTGVPRSVIYKALHDNGHACVK